MIRGARARNPLHLWLGLGILGFAVVLQIADMTSRSIVGDLGMRLLSTSSLISDITSSRGTASMEWQELYRRQLTVEERRELAVGLLDKRLRWGHLNNTEIGWLWPLVTTGALPDDVAERYYREMFEARIEAPARARTGEVFRVRLGSTRRFGSQPTGIDETVYFGGFWVGRAGAPIERKESYVYANLLNNPMHRIQADITPERAGPLRVRAALYFAVGPRIAGAARSVTWLDDETAILPATVMWSRRIEIETTIEVVGDFDRGEAASEK